MNVENGFACCTATSFILSYATAMIIKENYPEFRTSGMDFVE
jgi:hypothetical protein